MSENVTLDQLNYFWMPNGAPCFIADRDDICDIVENIGFSVYYVLGNLNKITKTTSTTYKPTTPGAATSSPVTTTTEVVTKNIQLFKIVSNFVGRAVAASTDPLPDNFLGLEESCIYSLPEIPLSMLEKLDQFFRLVHAQHGTESIVLLTFDPTKNDSSGWGVLVPEQTNTAAHCNYNAESVLALKPEHLYVVGSVHSHPEMPAYASGTDHADQADFDGIHITFGWQKSVNAGATQYHIELQLSGNNYKLDPEDVFESFSIAKDPDPEVVAWTDQVKKALPPSGGVPATTARMDTRAPHQTVALDTVPGETGSKKKISYKENIASLNVEHDAIVIAEVYPNEVGICSCPSCDYTLDDGDLYAGHCRICDIPISLESASINSIASNLSYYCKSRALPIDSPAYLWGVDNTRNEFLIKLNLDKISQDTFFDDADIEYVNLLDSHYDDDEDGFHPDYLICCGEKAEDYYSNCKCQIPVFFEDYKDFADETARMDLYQSKSQCESCQFYYTNFCPAYKKLIFDYTACNGRIELLQDDLPIVPCNEFYPFRSETSESSLYYN
jgi:hypothetical protein